MGRERKSNTKNVQSKTIRESQSNVKKEGTQLREKNEQWNAREERENMGFYVIPIETDFYGKVYPSLVLYAI